MNTEAETEQRVWRKFNQQLDNVAAATKKAVERGHRRPIDPAKTERRRDLEDKAEQKLLDEDLT
jgi:hypothetical protein|tara:strand:+ start:163 stop:354 length:192 start_codon:yes stop_codon:yes gene_type:complete